MMSERQQKLYRRIITKESKTSRVKDYVNTDISNSFFIGTRMVSNIIYPNNKLGKDGYDSLTDADFEMDRMNELSPKFVKILKRIKRSTGPVFVYSNFKEYGGIKPFIRFLEHYNFKNYESNGAGRKRFAVWSGDQKAGIREEIKAVFNNKDNADGSQIRVIIGSPAVKEGISFLRVRQVHIIEPYWNLSKIFQVMGRAIRFCSHKDLPYDDQEVKVYIYLAVHPKIPVSIDQYIMKMALQKQYVNNQFEKALKEAAIDCELFKNANVYPDDEEDIVCDI